LAGSLGVVVVNCVRLEIVKNMDLRFVLFCLKINQLLIFVTHLYKKLYFFLINIIYISYKK